MYFIELETSLASRLLFTLSVLMSYRALFVFHWTLCVASFTRGSDPARVKNTYQRAGAHIPHTYPLHIHISRGF